MYNMMFSYLKFILHALPVFEIYLDKSFIIDYT